MLLAHQVFGGRRIDLDDVPAFDHLGRGRMDADQMRQREFTAMPDQFFRIPEEMFEAQALHTPFDLETIEEGLAQLARFLTRFARRSDLDLDETSFEKGALLASVRSEAESRS